MGDVTREKAIELLNGGREGVEAWNEWRRVNKPTRKEMPDLSKAQLERASLEWANLERADFEDANLFRACLFRAKLGRANLERANLEWASLRRARVERANFVGANLFRANFVEAHLGHADFRNATLGGTLIIDVDLSHSKNLDAVHHRGPSSIDTQTLELSRGQIPKEFLQGCGLKPWEILNAKLYDPDLTPAQVNDIQYKIFEARTSGPLIIGGVFISYSRADARFADEVRDKLMKKGVSVWLDRHDMVAGPQQKQIDRAIGANNVILLVLSKDSIASDWVEHEMQAAHRIERKEGREVLCPVRLDDVWKKKRHDVKWEHLMDKNILDFSKWKTKAFNGQFDKLIKGLKIYYSRDDGSGEESES